MVPQRLRPKFRTDRKKLFLLSVALHNRMDEAILVLDPTHIDAPQEPDFPENPDEKLAWLIGHLYARTGSGHEILGFWTEYPLPPGLPIGSGNPIITAHQILGQAILEYEGDWTLAQVYGAFLIDTELDSEGKPPSLPKVQECKHLRIIWAKNEE